VSPPSARRAAAELATIFASSGYVRRPDERRRAARDRAAYKKGWEVRLVVASSDEAQRATQLIAVVGLSAGRLFRKGRRIIVPLYGARAVQWFLRELRRRQSLPAVGFTARGARVRRRASRGWATANLTTVAADKRG
jgi:hypothetical protein